MSGKNQFTAAEFIAAIPGTGGIVTAIARKVGCDWHTAKRYIEDYPTIKQAYDDERESVLDMSESVVFGNIRLAAEYVSKGLLADTGDAKWLLSRLGKERGYTDKIEQDITSKGEQIGSVDNDTRLEILRKLDSIAAAQGAGAIPEKSDG